MQLPLSIMIIHGLCFTAFGIYGIIAYKKNLKLGEENGGKRKVFKKGGLIFLITSIILLILGILPLLAGLAAIVKGGR